MWELQAEVVNRHQSRGISFASNCFEYKYINYKYLSLFGSSASPCKGPAIIREREKGEVVGNLAEASNWAFSGKNAKNNVSKSGFKMTFLGLARKYSVDPWQVKTVFVSDCQWLPVHHLLCSWCAWCEQAYELLPIAMLFCSSSNHGRYMLDFAVTHVMTSLWSCSQPQIRSIGFHVLTRFVAKISSFATFGLHSVLLKWISLNDGLGLIWPATWILGFEKSQVFDMSNVDVVQAS